MVTQLREVLKGLCSNYGWSYGVFWVFNRRNCMLLTMEDAYYDENVRILIEKMVQHTHIMGEGIIGQVAFTGKSRWMYSDSYCGEWNRMGSLNNQDGFEADSEFHGQFSSGIGTIAVVSVAPLGVIQFGSTQKIAERLDFVIQVKSLFQQLGSVDGFCLSRNWFSDLNCNMYDARGVLASEVDFENPFSNYVSTPASDDKDFIRRFQSAKVLPQMSHFTSRLNDSGTTPSRYNSSFPRSHPLHTAVAEAKVISSAPKMESQQILPMACLANNSVPTTSSNGSSFLTSLDHQNISGNGMGDSVSAFPPKTGSQVSCRNTSQNSREDSILSSLQETSRSLYTTDSVDVNGLIGFDSVKSVDFQLPAPLLNTTEGEPPKLSASSHKLAGAFRPSGARIEFSNTNQGNKVLPWSAQPLRKGNDGLASLPNDRLTDGPPVASPQSGMVAGNIINGVPVSYSISSMENSISAVESLSISDEKEMASNVSMQLQADNNFFDNMDLDFGCSLEKECWDDMLLPVSNGNHSSLSTDISSCISNLYVGSGIDTERGFLSDFGAENMFDDLIGNALHDDKPSSENQLSRTTVTKTGSQSLQTSPVQSNSISCFSGSMDSLPLGCNPTKSDNIDTNTVHKDNIVKSQLSSWVQDSYSINCESAATTKPKETGQPKKVIKKRARPGESTRPRPKDRQLIQERLKELREIVPSGAKCSIDSLLDRTIKHMLFLQGMNKYSNSVELFNEPKMIGEDSGVVMKDHSSGGGGGGDTTWAFEVGGKTMLCPILVEDITPLGQMLVEMLCEEQGLFLEIADRIRRFGLTILKGVMEVHNDKIWARFVVEASRDVTRMDIFLHLVHLLQETEHKLDQ